MSILQSVIPLQVADDCVESLPVNCGTGVVSNQTEANFKIEFPRNVSTLPLNGGAVISIGSQDLKLNSSQNVANIITRNLSVLQGLELSNKLTDLVKSKVAVNNALFDLARKDLKVIDEKQDKRKAPSVYFSIFQGEDPSVLVNGISNPKIIRICEFRYVPAESFAKILNNLTENGESEFSEIIGVSGRSFQSLRELAVNLSDNLQQANNAFNLPNISPPTFPSIGGSEPDIVDLVLEFFPIVNISEDVISSRDSNPTIGGYYTLLDGKIYLKLPDLSGKDSSGQSNSLITEDSSLWIEILSQASITRIPIENFKSPPMASFVGDTSFDFPKISPLEITFELTNDEPVTVYLSPIVKNISVNKKRSINVFNSSIELFTVPLLTKPIQNLGSRLPTISTDSIPSTNDILFVSNQVDKFYPGFSTSNSLNDFENTGIPFLGQLDPHIFFGEMNRPEIILSGNGQDNSENNNRYSNLASYGVLEILSSIRPKIYFDVPSQWFSSIPVQNLDGNYVATFASSNFSNIDLANFDGIIEYVAYVADSHGQITRINGPNIKLSDSTPSIIRIVPDGFNGSKSLILNDSNIIEIIGEDLAGVRQINFTHENGSLLFLIPNDGVMSQPTESNILLNFTSETLANKGFIAGEYSLVLQGSGSTLLSQEEKIYIVSSDDELRPVKGDLLAKFKSDEISSTEFGSDPVCGIPLFKNGSSATIGFKSKSKIFDGSRNIYAYLAVPSSASKILESFSFPDRIGTINTSKGELLVPLDINYTLGTSPFDDFSKSNTSNKKAYLKFPGKAFSNYNFSGLQNISKCYFLLTNRPLLEVLGTARTLSLAEEDHGILELGGDLGPGFIEPSTILGIAADIGGSNIVSSFPPGTFNIPEDIFGSLALSTEQINVFGKINRLAVIVAGIKENFLRKRFTVKLASLDLSKYISKSPIVLKPGQILFTFDNIEPPSDGLLPLTVDKKEKRFGSNYSTLGYSGQGTAIINGLDGINYSIDPSTGILQVNSSITSEEFISDTLSFLSNEDNKFGIVGSSSISTNIVESLFPNISNDGLIFDPRVTDSDTVYLSYNPFSITSTSDLNLKTDPLDSNIITNLFSGISVSDLNLLRRNYLEIPSGSSFNTTSYHLHENGSAVLVFYGANTTGLVSIKSNVPEVVAIAEDGQDFITLASNEEIRMTVGQKYKILVKNTDRDFIIKFDEIVLRPRGRPEPTSNPGEYIAIVEAPIELLTKQNCFEICASTDNATRNRAKFSLGRDFVIDLDTIFQEILTGPLKDKIPDIPGLFEKLKDAPLRFVSLVFDKANIPKDLIKSFCDLSFHLTAELKISLNGFQILMVPIQVIFCIIDVICSLLNPVKVAKSVIRLFQCLYDLILLLPQISIPVMFLQLILHLLELLKCIIDKILFTITAINEIAKAINLAAQKPVNFTAIKALEETLSQYLFEINADLTFLDPILSILSIFLQLLQLIFRFPCSIDPSGGASDCGVDGTMLAGIVAGIAAPDLEIIPEVMLPVAQSYSTDENEGSTESSYLVEPSSGDVIATGSDNSFLDSIAIDSDSLRGTSAGSGGIDFNATMSPTFTKSTKKSGKPTEVEFHFKSKALSTSLNSKNIDPNQTIDAPLAFFSKNDDEIRISENGNIYSPIDGESFLNVNGNTASVQPLVLNLEIPIYTTDPETGIPVQSGTETVTRTFDNIPKLVIMDDEFNVYFIKKDGIEFDNDGFVSKINAEIINQTSAPKMKFSKEDVELDTDNDPTTDDGSIEIFDFPQIYFFDMRQANEQLQQFCSTASINSFPFEDNNVEDITDIVLESQGCLTDYVSGVQSLVENMQTAQTSGTLPLPEISTSSFELLNVNLIDCLNGSVDKICKFVVNSLNTSFKIVEDIDETPLEDYTDGDIPEDVLDGFENLGPAFTGAREYAAGIGDSATVSVGSFANIELIPRDSYDEEIIGDLTKRITLEIISDTTGNASFVLNSDNTIVTKDGNSYLAKLTSTAIGEVKIRARICERTIQALTYEGIQENEDTSQGQDCVPDNGSNARNNSPSLGALTKVDRILTIFFIKSPSVVLNNNGGGNDLPSTEPQQFGSALEN